MKVRLTFLDKTKNVKHHFSQ